ncbi:hypothetical protein FRB98_003103 [Tulasnella sp. 332]|nr:hypothetical protein FRB98_003103 [Tulasnella sp. 332]
MTFALTTTTMAPLITTQTISSLLFRWLTWIHLRVQPIEQPAVFVLPATFAFWLIAWALERIPEGGPVPTKIIEFKEETGPIANGHGAQSVIVKRARPDPVPAPVRILFSLPSNLSVIRLSHVVINLALGVFLIDSLWQADPPGNGLSSYAANVTFARVGAVYPDGVKIQVRYPDLKFDESFLSPPQQPGAGACKVLWREAMSGVSESTVGMWKDGPVLQLGEDDDWVGVAHLDKLWPSTSYQFRLAYPNSTFLPYPPTPLSFKTFPDPRLQQGSKFKFIASSGIRSNFPYVPLRGPHAFKGLDLLANRYFPASLCTSSPSSSLPSMTPNAVVKDPAPQPSPADDGASRPSDSTAAGATTTETCPYHGVHHPTTPVDPNPVQTDALSSYKARSLWGWLGKARESDEMVDSVPNFMLLVGGPDTAMPSRKTGMDEYMKSYRGLYASSSFRTLYERIPIFNVLGTSCHQKMHEVIPADLRSKVATWLRSNSKPESVDSDDDTQASSWALRSAYETYAGEANHAGYGGKGLHYSFSHGDSAFFVLDTTSYRSGPDVAPCDRTILGESQMLDLWLWASKVNSTTTFKFIVSPIPLTSLWPFTSTWSTCAASERTRVIDLIAYVPNVIVISGGRQAFAAIEYPPPTAAASLPSNASTTPIYEFVIGPLSSESALQWDYPQEKVVRWENVTAVVPITGFGGTVENETIELEIEREEEKLIKFVRQGNHKWSAITVDTLTNPEKPTVKVELFSDGARIWSFTVVGRYVPLKTAGSAVGSTLRGGIRSVLDKIGLNPAGWFKS